MSMDNYYDHGKDQICDFCGETISQVEHESCNAELVDDKWICWTCQNHNPDAQELMETLNS
ncbi:hypothetical protein LCGC14_0361900 [marine sediment metagenome]|uniref:Uncharacterized protein n=1 Tax=marine sediment metagenome TaxID=412755 RepID=A0A0F9TQH5_9ZZZZ